MRSWFNLVNDLVSALSRHEDNQLLKRRDKILVRNTALGGSPDGFKHLGVIHTFLAGKSRSMGVYKPLHSSLIMEMDALLVERKVLETDMARIRQALFLTLEGCVTSQDIRDALPNCMKDFIQGLEKLERTRPEAFTLAENPRSYKQYMKLREKIDYYAATRLLY